MSRTQQTEQIIKSWTETQQKLWDSWASALQGSTPAKPADLWATVVTTWERAIDQVWDAQASMVDMWSKSIEELEGAPPESKAQLKQFREMLDNWTSTQRKLWNSWVEGLRDADPQKMGEAWQKHGEELMQTLKASTEKIMNTQREMVEQFTAKIRGG